MPVASVMSTDSVAPIERAAIWRDWIWTHFGGLESDLYGDTGFDGHMSASTAGDVVLDNVPHLHDVATMLKLLGQTGLKVQQDGEKVVLNGSAIDKLEAPYELVKTMRASILVLGPLLARFGEAKVSLPGGCAIGSRPVDQHIKGLQALGAEITIDAGYIYAKCKKLKGDRIVTDKITVTGTET
eukprot:gene18569-37553_t